MIAFIVCVGMLLKSKKSQNHVLTNLDIQTEVFLKHRFDFFFQGLRRKLSTCGTLCD